MYTFMARRIHAGKLTWEQVATFTAEAQKAIKKAYAKLYQNEEIPNDTRTIS